MNRKTSLCALLIVFFLAGLEAYADDEHEYSVTSIASGASNPMMAVSDNCSAQGYSWLDDNGQPVDG